MNEIDVMVGRRIRARRQSLGKSQTELGDVVGVKFQQIQKYETGQNRVSASRLWAIAEALDVPIVHFFEGIEPVNSGTRDEQTVAHDRMDFLADGRSVTLVEHFMQLPESQKKAVLSIVQSMSRDTDNPDEKKYGS